MYSDGSGCSAILTAILIGAGLDAVVGVGSQFISDAISNVISGKSFSEWQT